MWTKKIFSVCVVFYIVLACYSSCLALNGLSETNFIGEWYLTTLRKEDVELSLAGTGAQMIMTIRNDNISLRAEGLGAEFPENTIVDSFQFIGPNLVLYNELDGLLVFSLDDEVHMSCDTGQFVLTFEKSSTPQLSARLTNVNEKQFLGQWEASHVIVDGVKIPIDALGGEIDLLIRHGYAVFHVISSEVGAELKLELSAGVTGEQLVVSKDDVFAFTVSLHEDGTASFDMEDGTVILVKTAE